MEVLRYRCQPLCHVLLWEIDRALECSLRGVRHSKTPGHFEMGNGNNVTFNHRLSSGELNAEDKEEDVEALLSR